MGDACGSSLSPQKRATGTVCSPASSGKCYPVPGTPPNCQDFSGSATSCALATSGLGCGLADHLSSQTDAAKLKAACYDYYRACYPPSNAAAVSLATCPDAKAAALSAAESVGGSAAEAEIIKLVEEYINSQGGGS